MEWKHQDYMSAICFSLVAVYLIFALITLLRAITRFELVNCLRSESKLLKIVSIVWASIYMLQCIASIFTLTKGYHNFKLQSYLAVPLPILYDIVPIGVLVFYHFVNLRPKSEQEYQTLDEANEFP